MCHDRLTYYSYVYVLDHRLFLGNNRIVQLSSVEGKSNAEESHVTRPLRNLFMTSY